MPWFFSGVCCSFLAAAAKKIILFVLTVKNTHLIFNMIFFTFSSLGVSYEKKFNLKVDEIHEWMAHAFEFSANDEFS
jgi:hypothetical protein